VGLDSRSWKKMDLILDLQVDFMEKESWRRFLMGDLSIYWKKELNKIFY